MHSTFWERFFSLCVEAGVKPNSIREKIGVTSTGLITAWKNRGVIPARSTLMIIAAHFNTTVEYLLGESDDPGRQKPPAPPGKEKAPAPGGVEAGYSDKVIRVAGLIAALPEAAQDEMIRLAELLAQQRE